MLLNTLYQQEQALTKEEKKEFPLVERAIHTLLDIWDTNKVPLKCLEVSHLTPEAIWIQVNESSPVTFIKAGKEAVHAG